MLAGPVARMIAIAVARLRAVAGTVVAVAGTFMTVAGAVVSIAGPLVATVTGTMGRFSGRWLVTRRFRRRRIVVLGRGWRARRGGARFMVAVVLVRCAVALVLTARRRRRGRGRLTVDHPMIARARVGRVERRCVVNRNGERVLRGARQGAGNTCAARRRDGDSCTQHR